MPRCRTDFPQPLLRKIVSDNALATYPRLMKADRAMEIAV